MSQGIEFGAVSYNTALAACGAASQWEEMLKLLKECLSHEPFGVYGSGFRVSGRLCSTFIEIHVAFSFLGLPNDTMQRNFNPHALRQNDPTWFLAWRVGSFGILLQASWPLHASFARAEVGQTLQEAHHLGLK